MDESIFNESFDNTFLQMNDLGNTNEYYLSSHKFNLFQQFFIIGLEPKIIYNINKIELTGLPKKFLEPVIISKYPKISLPYLCIPDKIVASHCFPKGTVDIIKKDENTEKLKDSNFIFTLDNQGYEEKESSLRTRKVYYNCYYFYESVDDFNLFINLRENKKNENNSFNENYYIKKVICFSSFQPWHKEANIILRYLKKYTEKFSLNYQNNKIEIVENNYLPIEKIIEGLIFNIPSLPRSRYTLQLNKESFHVDNNNKNEEVDTKEIIFKETPINKLPKPNVDISNLINFFNIDEIFEIIKWIILEVPILFFSDNISELTYTIEGFISLIYPFVYSYPVVAILPEENYSMISVMKHFIFGINYKFSKEILLKKGINIQNLNMIAIIKIEKRFNDFVSFKEKDKSNNSPIIIYHSDKSKPILKLNQIYSYYNKNNSDKNEETKKQQVSLPFNPKEKSKKRFFDNIDSRHYNIKKKSNKEPNNKIICEELYEAVFNFFLHILLHYQEFCFKLKKKENLGENINDYSNVFYEYDDIIETLYFKNNLQIQKIFYLNDFLNIIPQNDKLFYTFFLNTKLFYDFIKKKTFPISLQDKFEVLFFDEKINEKQAELSNKQYNSPFLKYKFDDMNGNIFLSDFKKKISNEYKEFLLNTSNIKRAYNYFQYITQKEINNSNYISFNYLVFPKLLNDDIFYKEEITIDKFWDPERSTFTSSNSNCIYNQFEKQGKLVINKDNMLKKYDEYNYSLNLVSNFLYKSNDCILLLWLQYFSKTFHYTKLSERENEFKKMKSILKGVQLYDQNTLELLFWSTYKYGDSTMTQNLFDCLKNKSYISYLSLREKSKQQNNYLTFNERNEEEEEEEEEKKNEDEKSKSRIFFCNKSYCENKLCNYAYNNQDKTNLKLDNKINMIKFKCEKCKKEQTVTIKAIYYNEQGKNFNINFKLISPLALLKRKWFQDKLDLDLYLVIKEHLEPYLSTLFYFNLQQIYHDFIIPPKINNDSLSMENIISYQIKKEKEKEKTEDKIKPINIIYSNKNKDKKKLIRYERNKNLNFNNFATEENKSLNKSVSQNYLKTLSKKRLKVKDAKKDEKKKPKKLNDYSLELINEDFDLSDNNKMIFEFKNNSNKNILKTENNEIKSKIINKILNKKKIINNNIKGFPQNTQNSYEFFKKMKKKK